MTARKRAKAPERVEKLELTDREAAQRDRQRAANLERPERPEAKFVRKTVGDKTNITITAADHQDDKLHSAAMMEAFGTRSLPFLNDTMDNINRVLARGGIPTEQQYNAALAILASVEPQNELEATLASQIVAANECAFRCMRGMLGSDMVDHHRMYGDLANKFMRTVTAQVEALAKLRRGGEQVVKYIHVHEGGQAVVAGTINQQRGVANGGSGEQPYGAEAAPGSAALPCPDAAWNGVPIPCDAEREVQDPRWEESRSAEGEPECVEARATVGSNEAGSSAAA